jgi:hypothetical protein
MTTHSHLTRVARIAVIVCAVTPMMASAQALKPAGLRPSAATAKDSAAKSAPTAPGTPSSTTIAAEKSPPKLPPKETVGLSAAEKRRINNAMTRPRKAPAKPPVR